MNLPTRQEIIKLFDTYGVPENIRAHSEAVADFGAKLALALNEAGVKVDVNLVYVAGFTHDIGKWLAIEEDIREPGHATISAEILRGEGMPKRLQEVVLHHILDYVAAPEFKDFPIEDKLVFYADKRVAHHEITTLKKRFVDLYKRYPKELIAPFEKPSFKLEKELFVPLTVDPDKFGL